MQVPLLRLLVWGSEKNQWTGKRDMGSSPGRMINAWASEVEAMRGDPVLVGYIQFRADRWVEGVKTRRGQKRSSDSLHVERSERVGDR